jgi:FkbM family methyltransferase
MSLHNKIELLSAALRLGHGWGDKLSLLRLFARYGGLSTFSAKDLALRVNEPPGAQLHLRDTVADAILLVEVLVQQDYAALKPLALRPTTMLDVGANIGLGSFYLRHLFPTATLHGLEPAPAESEVCARNYQSLGNATLHRVAAGDTDGVTTSFAIHPEQTGGQHISTTPPTGAGWQNLTVLLRRIDAMIDEGSLPIPDLVKMDIEGSEVSALRGFGRYLAAPTAYILETHSPQLHQECLDLLCPLGFRVASDTPRPGTARILCLRRA